MKRAVLISGHIPWQKRRASLLWVSDHLQEAGWHVTHVIAGYSYISQLRGDKRLRALPRQPLRGSECLGPSLTVIFDLSPIHPFSTGFKPLDKAFRPLHETFLSFWSEKLKKPLSQARLVITESGPPVMLGPVIAHHAPHAARLYRVNDDIRLLGAPDWLAQCELAQSATYTRISTASPHLAHRFADHPNVTLDPMGIPRAEVLHHATYFPSDSSLKTAICAGTTQIDIPALMRIAQDQPGWRIHVYGALKSAPPEAPNIMWHGEQPFRNVMQHIAKADIGLAPYLDRPGIEYQTTNSNRMLLYRHFGLPILGPDRLCHPSLPLLIGYCQPDAYNLCETTPRQPEHIPDWSDLAARLAQNPEIEPLEEVSTVPARFVCPRV